MSSFSFWQWLIFGAIIFLIVRAFRKPKLTQPPSPPHSAPPLPTLKTSINDKPWTGQPTQDLNPFESKDNWEGSFYDVGTQRSAKKTVRITYIDGSNAATERVVDIRAFEPKGSVGLLIGRCHLRNATRTFRFDRMRRVVNEETGEIIPDLQQQLNAEWEASPEPLMDTLYAQHRDLLKLMLFMAKADGAMRAAEVAVITTHCVELTGDDRVTPELVKELLGALDAPSITSFIRIYNKLRREQPEEALRAAQACRAIVATQKTVHPTEQAALDALEKPLPQLASS